jgi:hypothetical protein
MRRCSWSGILRDEVIHETERIAAQSPFRACTFIEQPDRSVQAAARLVLREALAGRTADDSQVDWRSVLEPLSVDSAGLRLSRNPKARRQEPLAESIDAGVLATSYLFCQ